MVFSSENGLPKTLTLASRSPRRRQLLSQLGIDVCVVAADIDETPHREESPRDYVRRLAIAKCHAVMARLETGSPVLAADTAVVSRGSILGKPRDRDEGVRMLTGLAGGTHEVLTGVAVAIEQRMDSRVSCSEVQFRDMSPAECLAYWETGEGVDKAGGYAIQGLGAIFAERISGSYSGVMGLPLFETAELLRSIGIDPLCR